MLNTHESLDLELFIASLETMAFIVPAPPAPPLLLPADCQVASIRFRGPHGGVIQIAASLQFGALLASSLLGCDPGDSQALAYAPDALKELLNVFAGATLDRFGASQGAGFEMSTPAIEPLADEESWRQHLLQCPEQACDADGHLVIIRLVES